MGMRQEQDMRASEEAALWLQRLRDEDTPEVRAAFSDWVRRGVGNLQEFLLAQAMWRELDHIDAGTRERLWSAPDEGTVVDFASRQAPPVQATQATALPRRRARVLAAACVVMFAVLTGALWFQSRPHPDTFVTRIGEQKTVKLSDGSVVYLNTGSRIEVGFRRDERVVTLVAGEALFSIAHDAARPFYVLTDSARIRAVGTQFNVYRNSGAETRVAVIEGVVQVSRDTAGTEGPVRLGAGDEAKVGAKGVVKSVEPSVQRAVSWRSRRLVFPDNPVGEISEEFNRYNSIPIRIEGEALRERRMGGTFDADDPAPLLDFLARDSRVEIQRGEKEILVRVR